MLKERKPKIKYKSASTRSLLNFLLLLSSSSLHGSSFFLNLPFQLSPQTHPLSLTNQFQSPKIHLAQRGLLRKVNGARKAHWRYWSKMTKKKGIQAGRDPKLSLRRGCWEHLHGKHNLTENHMHPPPCSPCPLVLLLPSPLPDPCVFPSVPCPKLVTPPWYHST